MITQLYLFFSFVITHYKRRNVCVRMEYEGKTFLVTLTLSLLIYYIYICMYVCMYKSIELLFFLCAF